MRTHSSPALDFLDEPSLGLDVQARREVWNYILRLKKQGTTLFLCTNYMDEAERLCDAVATIDRGKFAAVGSPEALRSRLKRDITPVQVAGPNERHREWLEALEKAFSHLGMVRRTLKNSTQIKLCVDSNETALPRVLRCAATLSIPTHSITYSRFGLAQEGGENIG